MKEEKKLLLSSALCMIIYDVYMFIKGYGEIDFNNPLDRFEIVLFILSLIGIGLFSYFSFSKKDLEKYRGIIIFNSVIFFFCNIVSGVIGFMSLKYIKKEDRKIPELDLKFSYKWYVYLIVLLISLGVVFGLSELFTNKYQLYVSYLLLLLLNVGVFRNELKRDVKYFIKNFKAYNSYVLSMYGKSLLVLIVLSLSVKLYTGLDTSTNQITLNELIRQKPIISIILAVIYSPIVEEILFRGIFRNFIKNKWAYIIISGLLFGLAHVIDDFQSINELLYVFVYGSLGCFMAAVYHRTNNLCANIYLHFMQNSISIILILLVFYLGL